MTVDQIEAEFGELSAAQRRFADLVVRFLDQGVIPGPTRLNRAMGAGGRRSNMLSGRYSKLRRFIFEKAGLVREGPFYNPRYQFPKGDWRRVEKQPR